MKRHSKTPKIKMTADKMGWVYKDCKIIFDDFKRITEPPPNLKSPWHYLEKAYQELEKANRKSVGFSIPLSYKGVKIEKKKIIGYFANGINFAVPITAEDAKQFYNKGKFGVMAYGSLRKKALDR